MLPSLAFCLNKEFLILSLLICFVLLKMYQSSEIFKLDIAVLTYSLLIFTTISIRICKDALSIGGYDNPSSSLIALAFMKILSLFVSTYVISKYKSYLKVNKDKAFIILTNIIGIFFFFFGMSLLFFPQRGHLAKIISLSSFIQKSFNFLYKYAILKKFLILINSKYFYLINTVTYKKLTSLLTIKVLFTIVDNWLITLSYLISECWVSLGFSSISAAINTTLPDHRVSMFSLRLNFISNFGSILFNYFLFYVFTNYSNKQSFLLEGILLFISGIVVLLLQFFYKLTLKSIKKIFEKELQDENEVKQKKQSNNSDAIRSNFAKLGMFASLKEGSKYNPIFCLIILTLSISSLGCLTEQTFKNHAPKTALPMMYAFNGLITVLFSEFNYWILNKNSNKNSNKIVTDFVKMMLFLSWVLTFAGFITIMLNFSKIIIFHTAILALTTSSVKVTKYILFDVTRESMYLFVEDKVIRMQLKNVIDSLLVKYGKGLAALFIVFASLYEIYFKKLVLILGIIISLVWISTIYYLNLTSDELNDTNNNNNKSMNETNTINNSIKLNENDAIQKENLTTQNSDSNQQTDKNAEMQNDKKMNQNQENTDENNSNENDSKVDNDIENNSDVSKNSSKQDSKQENNS